MNDWVTWPKVLLDDPSLWPIAADWCLDGNHYVAEQLLREAGEKGDYWLFQHMAMFSRERVEAREVLYQPHLEWLSEQFEKLGGLEFPPMDLRGQEGGRGYYRGCPAKRCKRRTILMQPKEHQAIYGVGDQDESFVVEFHHATYSGSCFACSKRYFTVPKVYEAKVIIPRVYEYVTPLC